MDAAAFGIAVDGDHAELGDAAGPLGAGGFRIDVGVAVALAVGGAVIDGEGLGADVLIAGVAGLGRGLIIEIGTLLVGHIDVLEADDEVGHIRDVDGGGEGDVADGIAVRGGRLGDDVVLIGDGGVGVAAVGDGGDLGGAGLVGEGIHDGIFAGGGGLGGDIGGSRFFAGFGGDEVKCGGVHDDQQRREHDEQGFLHRNLSFVK